MKKSQETTVISRYLQPWIALFCIFFFLALFGLLVWAVLWEDSVSAWECLIPMGIMVLLIVAMVGFCGLQRAAVSPEGVTLSVWRFPYKHIAAKDIRTVIRRASPTTKGRVELLAIAADTEEEIEARGEQALRKEPFIRHELKFREGRSDWRDLCIGAGPLGKRSIWVEYSPKRQELFQKMFPNAVFRTGKNMDDPPSRT